MSDSNSIVINMKTKKQDKFRLRFKYVDYNLNRWTPLGWSTNNEKKAKKEAEKHRGDQQYQVWDYEKKRAI